MIIQHNLASMNAQNNYKINTNQKAKKSEKLASGLRINRAADDAAGLTISESMRAQIRGLNRGSRNAEDGISWMQTGDGALNEVHAMLHRMSELAIQSLNDTNTEEDRAALQQEFDALQSQIDQIGKETSFNTMQIFEQHQGTFYQQEGNINWTQGQIHNLMKADNELTVSYIKEDGGAQETFTISVPEGSYTTQELIDEIDDALEDAGLREKGFNLEFTKEGTCNLNFEGGMEITGIDGDLAYLLNDTYDGGSVGALIGTTIFNDPYGLNIVTGKNDEMFFEVQDFNGNSKEVAIKIPPQLGGYTRQEMIDFLNNKMTELGLDVEAVSFGKSIKLKSDSSIITGFKGNMFEIDGAGSGTVYNSVFYDNIQHGTTVQSPAIFYGGYVVPISSTDEEHNHYSIDSTNNELKVAIDGGAQKTITIPQGEYTVAQMAERLQQEFAANGMQVYVESMVQGSAMGLKITTKSEGIDSKIDIDKTSSAYDTLFTRYARNEIQEYAKIDREYTSDSPAYVLGAKIFTGSNVPLTITSGVNDSFKLTLDNTNTYTIKLAAGNYTSGEAIKNALNDALNGSGALAGYKDKLNVTLDNSRLLIQSKTGNGISSVKVGEVAGNTGYSDLFVRDYSVSNTTSVSDTGTSSRPAQITLNGQINEPHTFTGSDGKLTVNVNGVDKTIDLGTGTKSRTEILDKINDALKEKTTTATNSYPTINVSGTTTINTVTINGYGNTSVESKTINGTPGVYKGAEGEVGVDEVSIPAKLTVDKALPSSVTVTNGVNDLFAMTINGVTHSFQLAEGTYTRAQMVQKIQEGIDNSFGKYYGGAKVSLGADGKLNFEARLVTADGKPIEGDKTSLKTDTVNNTFLKEMYTTRTPATAISSKPISASTTIDGTNNTFVFHLNDGTRDEDVTLTLDAGTYARSEFANQINKQLTAKGIDVTASINGSNQLVLQTGAKGNGLSITYSNQNGKGGTSAQALFGDTDTKTAATGVANATLKDSITLDGTNNTFKARVNGVTYTIALNQGTYTKDGYLAMLNQKLQENHIPMKAALESGKIRYTTTTKGSDSSIYMNASDQSGLTKALYGTTTTTTPGATASFTGDGRLQLTTTNNGGSLSVSSGNGGAFQKPVVESKKETPSTVTGYSSTKHAYIDGASMTAPVTIDKWNSRLNFTFYDNGVAKNIGVDIPQNTYTFADLQTTLSGLLDGAAGAGKLAVTVDGNGVRIECTKPGSKNYMSNFSGGFYNNILNRTKEYVSTKGISETKGSQSASPAFAIGRRDIKNENVEIQAGVNDTLEFEVTVANTTYKLSNANGTAVKLAAGTYNGTELIAELQKQINKSLVSLGIPSDFVKAQIGGVNTGVHGANDANALCLIQNTAVNAPKEGAVIIEGVKGNAAFSIFYQTDGKMEPAYVKGSKNLNEEVVIDGTNNELAFDIDGTTYTVTLDEGTYQGSQLTDMLNQKFTAQNIPAQTKLDGDVLKIFYQSYGNHTIRNIAGSAKDTLFYQTNSATDQSNALHLQLSGKASDNGIVLPNGSLDGSDSVVFAKRIMNTVELGINSVVITDRKYAEKALTRVQKAVEKVSDIRSEMGAMQNRLEHAVLGNDNNAENTQAAESRLRDADMASEMVEHSKYNILQQVGQAMITQANSIPEMVVSLLQS